MLEIVFRLRHECVFGKLSQEFPTVVMSNWCNFTLEILEYKVKHSDVETAIQNALARLSKRGFKTLSRTARDGAHQLVLMRCGHTRGTSVDEILEDAGCLVLYPVVYEGGWERYRVIALDDEKLPDLFTKLRGIAPLEIESKRHAEAGLLSHNFVIPSSQLLGELTSKQATALRTAIQHGYYRVPRKIRFEDIARAKKTPRTTFEEHVRKAESKIMMSLEPYVALFADAQA